MTVIILLAIFNVIATWPEWVIVAFYTSQIILSIILISLPISSHIQYHLLRKLLTSKPKCAVEGCTVKSKCMRCEVICTAMKPVLSRTTYFFVIMITIVTIRAIMHLSKFWAAY